MQSEKKKKNYRSLTVSIGVGKLNVGEISVIRRQSTYLRLCTWDGFFFGDCVVAGRAMKTWNSLGTGPYCKSCQTNL